MRTHLRRYAAALLAAALSLTLLATPASAAYDDTTSDSDSSGSSGGYGDGSWSCSRTDGSMLRRFSSAAAWTRWYERYLSCEPSSVKLPDGTTYTSNAKTRRIEYANKMNQASSGYLVYRFYGTKANPAAAVTRSRVDFDTWAENGPKVRIYAPNPADASSKRSAAPFVTSWGTNRDAYLAGSDSHEYAKAANGAWTTTGATKVTAQACTALRAETPLSAYYADRSAEEKVLVKAMLGSIYWNASSNGKYPSEGRAEAGLKTISGYRFNWDAWVAGDPTKAPKKDAKGDSYYASKLTFDNTDCSSPMQFYNTSEKITNDTTYTGVCYIPLIRRYESAHIVSKATSQKIGDYNYYLAKDAHRSGGGQGFGERFSDQYKNDPYAYKNGRGDKKGAAALGLTAKQRQALVKTWRQTMKSDYLAWTKGGVTKGGVQFAPMNSYSGGSLFTPATYSQTAAAQELFDNSKCVFSSTPFLQFDPEEPEPDGRDGVQDLEVDVADYFQVSTRPATASVDAEGLKCLNEKGVKVDCSKTVKAATFGFNTTLTGTNGYKVCKVDNFNAIAPAGCDAVYTVKSAGGKKKTGDTIQARFLRATSANQMVRVSVSNIAGTYTTASTTGGGRYVGSTTVGGYTLDLPTTSTKTTHNYTGTAAKPEGERKLTQNGNSFYVDVPVIGAISVGGY